MTRRTAALALCLVAAGAATIVGGAAAAPPNLDDLSGHFAGDAWAAALGETRSPVVSDKEGAPLAFTVEKRKDGTHRLAITDFHEGSWRRAYELRETPEGLSLVLGPFEVAKPTAKQRTLFPISLERDAAGRVTHLTASLWTTGAPAIRYRRLPGPAQAWARALVFAGRWTEAATGATWAFDPAGRVTRPGQKPEPFEINLDSSEACCDWLTVSGGRVGFAWREKRLLLYRIVRNPDECPISCEKVPFVILAPESSRPAALK
jgi:hypothetical protein